MKDLFDETLFGWEVAKFQKCNPREVLTQQLYAILPPVSYESYAAIHEDCLENIMAFPSPKLKTYTDEIGSDYCCTVWDVNEIVSIRLRDSIQNIFHSFY